jgi:tellurite resistance protein TehA-like permease
LRFRFHDVDVTILLLIWGNVILAAVSLLSLGSRGFERAMSTLSILAFVFFGILSIMFATRLLRLPGNLYGLLKPFCYISIVGGICFITVFLSPMGIIAGAVTDVILGVIFFRAAEEPPSAEEILSTPIE